jgi:hypothetical protein
VILALKLSSMEKSDENMGMKADDLRAVLPFANYN